MHYSFVHFGIIQPIHSTEPQISVRIPEVHQLIAAQHHSIHCQVEGTESLRANISYQWSKDGSVISNEAGRDSHYIFNSLKLSDAGVYNCEIAVASPYLDTHISSSANFTLRVTSEYKY